MSRIDQIVPEGQAATVTGPDGKWVKVTVVSGTVRVRQASLLDRMRGLPTFDLQPVTPTVEGIIETPSAEAAGGRYRFSFPPRPGSMPAGIINA